MCRSILRLVHKTFIKQHQVVVIATFRSNIIQYFELNLGTGVVSPHSSDDLDSIVAIVPEILALECSSKCSISEETHNFKVADFGSDFVLEMAGVLVFVWGVRAFDFLAVVRGGFLG